jgi:hypothetical protein
VSNPLQSAGRGAREQPGRRKGGAPSERIDVSAVVSQDQNNLFLENLDEVSRFNVEIWNKSEMERRLSEIVSAETISLNFSILGLSELVGFLTTKKVCSSSSSSSS